MEHETVRLERSGMVKIDSRQVEVNGRRHHIVVGGAGGPAVALEPAIGDVGWTWAPVLDEVSRFTTVFTHDRPGLGESEPVEGPRTVAAMAGELRSALSAAGVSPPYVLVGHSFASLTVQRFALEHPDEVAGIVLVDGAHEDQMERFPAELDPRPMLAALTGGLRQAAEAARAGEVVAGLVPVPEALGAHDAEPYRAATRPSAARLETAAAEYEGLEESQHQVRELSGRGFGDTPLIAIRHGVPQTVPGVSDDVNSRYEQTWRELQEELAARSRRGSLVVADGAGHMVHHDRPDVVVDAIRTLVAERRG